MIKPLDRSLLELEQGGTRGKNTLVPPIFERRVRLALPRQGVGEGLG